MAVDRVRITISPKGMGLNDFVALEEGFFDAEGLAVDVDWATFRGIQTRWTGMEYFERPQDLPYADNKEVVQGACEWGTVCNASAGMGRVVAEAYGVSPWSIFVRPDSRIHGPEDLADVPVAVGMRAGSHFNVPYRLESYLPLDKIKCEFVGGFSARLEALLSGEVEAASLLPPQIDMAKQFGLREIMADEFRTLWWVPDATPPEAVAGYMRALERAEQVLQANLPRYLPLWKYSIPAAFQDREWDFSSFSRGERFVYEEFPKEDFEEIFSQVERWGLGQYIQETGYDDLVFGAST